VRARQRLLLCGLAGGVVAAFAIAACQLVDPPSTIDQYWAADGGGDGEGVGVHCYVDVVEEQAFYAYCTGGQSCCYSGSFLGTGQCQRSACADLDFTCSDKAACGPDQVCCSHTGLMGQFLVLAGSSCIGADACGGNDIVLCDQHQSGLCPTGKSCQSNGMNNRPLGYASCQQ
jgi:hypothetical protein